MVLAMSRPFKHPKTGIYYFRKAVPGDLRLKVGKREVKQSLHTKDPTQARRRFALKSAEVERMFSTLRAPEIPLTHKQIVALSGEVYRKLHADYEQNPTSFLGNKPGVYLLLDTEQGYFREKTLGYVMPVINDLLLEKGVSTNEESKERLFHELRRVAEQLADQLVGYEKGDYRPDPDAERFPPFEPSRNPSPSIKMPPNSQSLSGLVEDWWREAQITGLSSKTYESYRGTMSKLISFLGHDDAKRVTAEDIISFKDHRLAEISPRTKKPISAKTVKDSDLAGLKAIFNWAVANRKLNHNPAEKVTIKLGMKIKMRPSGFTDTEANLLLNHALDVQLQTGKNHKLQSAKRWIPWLCAYTGARVGEMVQLRKQDIHLEGGTWVITITPEAGAVKTKTARRVPLHAHLVDMGFPEFASSGAGYLLIEPNEHGQTEKTAKTAANRLREFVHEVITDKIVQPNHAWRHRFKTVCREARIDRRIMDEMQGHASASVSDDYGEVTIRAMANALERFPRQGEINPAR